MTSPWPEIGTPLNQILTPMPVIDEDRLAANIRRAQTYFDEHGKAFRPHIKTHKIVAVPRPNAQPAPSASTARRSARQKFSPMPASKIFSSPITFSARRNWRGCAPCTSGSATSAWWPTARRPSTALPPPSMPPAR
jgi:hypothetical protein